MRSSEPTAGHILMPATKSLSRCHHDHGMAGDAEPALA